MPCPSATAKRYGSGMPGVVDAVAGGWEASSIINLQSGQPLNLRYGDTDGRLSDGQADFLGNVALRPSVVDPAAGILAPSGQRTYDNYFNRANIVIPAGYPTVRKHRTVMPSTAIALYQVNLMMQKNFALPLHQ